MFVVYDTQSIMFCYGNLSKLVHGFTLLFSLSVFLSLSLSLFLSVVV